jgi:hypothetical protein
MPTLKDLLTSTYKGAQGDQGDPGIGVDTVEVSANGDLIVTFSDSSIVNAGRVYDHKITVGNTEPTNPSLFDLWVDTN